MHNIPSGERAPKRAKRSSANIGRDSAAIRANTLGALSVLAAMWLPMPAKAVDGCLVLLCFAAPSWRAIPQCVPPIREVLRDLARGRPFPTCAMAGTSNSASHAWASAPAYCPEQYTRVFESENGPVYSCDFTGAVSVSINGAPFARTWWSMAGDTVTQFTPAAKAQLGSWDSRFDDDYATWLASLPAAAPADPGR